MNRVPVERHGATHAGGDRGENDAPVLDLNGPVDNMLSSSEFLDEVTESSVINKNTLTLEICL